MKYEFDIAVEVEPYTDDNVTAELSKFFVPLTEQGVTFEVVSLHGPGGGHPQVYVEGDPSIIRPYMQEAGWDESDEDFDETYQVVEA